MTIYNPPGTPASGIPNVPIGVHGEFLALNHLHQTVTIGAALTTADTVNFGYLPPNAVVTGVMLKAATQLDSNGSPTLAFNMGITGTAALFLSAVTTVGRAAGASADASSLLAGGRLYKNTTGAKVLVICQPTGNAATGAAGTLEALISYFVEE